MSFIPRMARSSMPAPVYGRGWRVGQAERPSARAALRETRLRSKLAPTVTRISVGRTRDELQRDALRKELQDTHATYEPEILKLRKELEEERIRARQYQWRAENDA